MSLGSTLLVVSLIVTLGFSLSGLSVSQLGLAKRADNRQQAQNMAESAIALGIEKVRADEKYAGGLLTIQAGEATGYLTFQETEGLLASTNNLAGTSSAVGSGDRAVPAGTVRLVGEGRCGDAVRRVEAFLRAPACPYALASSGRIEATGGLMVGSVKSSDEVPPILADPAANPPRPGDLVANSDRDDAVVLQGQSLITGDLQTAGEVQAANPGSDIWGEVRAHCDPVVLPEVDVGSYDPLTTGKPHSSLDAPPEDNPRLSGVVRFNSSQVIPGTLTLDSSLVFVKGDLTVKGGVKGRGALVVTGRTRLENGATLDAGNRVCLLGQGSVDILGSGKQSSAFQGIVYTEGDFTVEKITVVGSLFSKGSLVKLGDCNLLANPESEHVSLGTSGQGGSLLAPSEEGQDVVRQYYEQGYLTAEEVVGLLPAKEVALEFARQPGRLTVKASSLAGMPFEIKELTLDPEASGAADELYGFLWNHKAKGNFAALVYPASLSLSKFMRDTLVSIGMAPPVVPPTVPFDDVLRTNLQVTMGGTVHTFPRTGAADLLKEIKLFTESGGGDVFRFDPSQFLTFEQRARIALWKDL